MPAGRPIIIVDIAEGKDVTKFVISSGGETRVVHMNDDCVPLLVATLETYGIKHIKLKEVGEPLLDWLKRKCEELGIDERVING